MKSFFTSILLLIFSSAINANDWKLVSSDDGYWIKTSSNSQHEMLLAYKNNNPQFLLILKTDSPVSDKPIPVKIKIDKGEWKKNKLIPLQTRPEQSIFRLEFNNLKKDTIISKMIAGINLSINFNSAPNKNKYLLFSLHGFTVAFNDLLIANKIGSLDSRWLISHKKDRELYCLLTTNISIQAMELRLQNKNYTQAQALISKTGYSIIDHNLGEIIEQVYKLPLKNIPYVPRAEKFIMFSRCIKQPFQ